MRLSLLALPSLAATPALAHPSSDHSAMNFVEHLLTDPFHLASIIGVALAAVIFGPRLVRALARSRRK